MGTTMMMGFVKKELVSYAARLTSGEIKKFEHQETLKTNRRALACLFHLLRFGFGIWRDMAA